MPDAAGTLPHCGPTARGLSLPVLHPPLRKSRMTRWRAAVLIGVYVIMAIHILQWLRTGMTVSPVEPSEAMYTLELGKLNAGFIFFALALLSTFLFGRFFCGWGCHVVALQDACTGLMNKVGVRPRPFRTRLLPLWTLLLALYMFVWPSLKRAALFPALEALKIDRPLWLKEVAPFTGFEPEFIVRDFWATFAPWYIAIPFLLTCGFAAVYFLGNKGFCTYGCPYGGFFAPLDKVSIGRIVVNDDCEQCGHCTASCTSNVRVHEEVRDYGAVVDPGCMKCMDCVSVCPKDALSFSFGKPSLFTKPRVALVPERPRPKYDLSLPAEVVILFLGVILFVCFRQMLDMVPLLFAGGLAGIGAFTTWKLFTLLREPNVRLQSLQLKLKGRLRPVGMVFALAAVALLAAAAWSGYVRSLRFRADLLDRQVRVPFNVVFAPGYAPDPNDARRAGEALEMLRRADSPAHGGVGWLSTPDGRVRMSWLAAVAGDLERSEQALRDAIDQSPSPNAEWYFGLARIAELRGQPIDLTPLLRAALERHPENPGLRLALARTLLVSGDPEGAAGHARALGDHPEASDFQVAAAAEILAEAVSPNAALPVIVAGIARHPKSAILRATHARVLFFGGQPAAALTEIESATRLEPRNPTWWFAYSEMLGAAARPEEARRALERAELLVAEHSPH